MSEHDRVTDYLNGLNLIEYIGFHKNSDVAVLTDSGYDSEKIQNVILEKGWNFVTALKNSRGVKSEAGHAGTPKSRNGDGVAIFFNKYRKLAWETVRILMDGPKKKRLIITELGERPKLGKPRRGSIFVAITSFSPVKPSPESVIIRKAEGVPRATYRDFSEKYRKDKDGMFGI